VWSGSRATPTPAAKSNEVGTDHPGLTLDSHSLAVSRAQIPGGLTHVIGRVDCRNAGEVDDVTVGADARDIGRDCRDAFLGLAKTCAKLEIAFWDYLGDRLAVPGCQAIPRLPEIILARARSP
jgi:hypothetical protein